MKQFNLLCFCPLTPQDSRLIIVLYFVAKFQLCILYLEDSVALNANR